MSDEPKGPSSTWLTDDDGNIIGPLEHLSDGNWAAEGEELAEVDLEALADMAKNMEVAILGRRPHTSLVSSERHPLAKFVFEVDRSKPLALGTVQGRWVVHPSEVAIAEERAHLEKIGAIGTVQGRVAVAAVNDASARAAELVSPADVELVGDLADDLGMVATPYLDSQGRVFIGFGREEGSWEAAVLLDSLIHSTDPIWVVEQRIAELPPLAECLRRATEKVGPRLLLRPAPTDSAAPFWRDAASIIEDEALCLALATDEATADAVRRMLVVYRVVVSLVANEHRVNVSLEPR